MTPTRVGVLTVDPGLAEALPPAERPRSEAAAPARTIEVAAGPWEVSLEPSRFRGWLGLLVLEGLLARHVEIEAMAWTELLGPGDLLQPWTHASETASTLPARSR